MLDGDDVDVDRLELTLAAPEGRAILGDFLTARRLVRASDADPPPDLQDQLLRLNAADRRPAFIRSVAAAVLLLLAFASGWLASLTRPPNGAPPAVSRTVTFERNVDWYSRP
jgi:hypothetical protein